MSNGVPPNIKIASQGSQAISHEVAKNGNNKVHVTCIATKMHIITNRIPTLFLWRMDGRCNGQSSKSLEPIVFFSFSFPLMEPTPAVSSTFNSNEFSLPIVFLAYFYLNSSRMKKTKKKDKSCEHAIPSFAYLEAANHMLESKGSKVRSFVRHFSPALINTRFWYWNIQNAFKKGEIICMQEDDCCAGIYELQICLSVSPCLFSISSTILISLITYSVWRLHVPNMFRW